VKRRRDPPRPGKSSRTSTVRRGPLAREGRAPRPLRRARLPKSSLPKTRIRSRQVAHIVDEDQASLLDLIDNLLNKGVTLNAELVLALANVDLVHVRLSALLCAADRLVPRERARDK